MKQREDRDYQIITCRELFPCVCLFALQFPCVSVCFPVKVSHFTMLLSRLKES